MRHPDSLSALRKERKRSVDRGVFFFEICLVTCGVRALLGGVREFGSAENFGIRARGWLLRVPNLPPRRDEIFAAERRSFFVPPCYAAAFICAEGLCRAGMV